MRANPTVIGAFVIGALVVGVAGALVFSSGDVFKEKDRFVVYFDEAADGLGIGSPVTLRGVKVGSVVDVGMVFDLSENEVYVPVVIEMPRHEFEADMTDQERTEMVDALIKKGLRGTLEKVSMITGQLAIGFDFYPDEPARFLGRKDAPYRELPTIRTGISKFVKDLEKLPLRELFEDARKALQGIDERVRSEGVTKAIDGVSETLAEYKKVAQKLNDKIDPLAESLKDTSDQVRSTFEKADKTLATLEKEISEAESAFTKLATSIDTEVEPTAKSVRDALDEAQAALEEIKGAAANAKALLAHDSPTLTRFGVALIEIAEAMSSIGKLAELLKRQPESLLQGKRKDK